MQQQRLRLVLQWAVESAPLSTRATVCRFWMLTIQKKTNFSLTHFSRSISTMMWPFLSRVLRTHHINLICHHLPDACRVDVRDFSHSHIHNKLQLVQVQLVARSKTRRKTTEKF